MRNKELEDVIYNYIKDNEDDAIDSVDIVHSFPKYPAEFVLLAINYLRTNKRIKRVEIGIHYKYIIL